MTARKPYFILPGAVLAALAALLSAGHLMAAPAAAVSPAAAAAEVSAGAAPAVAAPEKTKPVPPPATPPAVTAPPVTAQPATPPVDPDDEAAAEKQDAETAAVAKPVTPDPVQIYGWREHIYVRGIEEKLLAKLDTGALTSSIHAEEKELFERDGKKWIRFIVTDPSMKKPVRTRIEAPLVRLAHVKEPAGESVSREVVKLNFRIGDRKLRGDFTLNNRSNMLAPVLIGRSMIKELGWVDPGRTNLADQKIFR